MSNFPFTPIGMNASDAVNLKTRIQNEQQGKLFSVNAVIVRGSTGEAGQPFYRVDATDMGGNHVRFNSEYSYEQWLANGRRG